jgi:hypothetical protein
MSPALPHRTGPTCRSASLPVSWVLLALMASWHSVQAQTPAPPRDQHLKSDLAHSPRPAIGSAFQRSSLLPSDPRPSADPPVDLAGPTSRSPNLEPERIWSVELADSTLRLCLKRWAQEAQWQLIWDADRDFVVEAEVRWQGTFEQALTALLESLRNSEYPLQARLNTDGRILRIQRLTPAQEK